MFGHWSATSPSRKRAAPPSRKRAARRQAASAPRRHRTAPQAPSPASPRQGGSQCTCSLLREAITKGHRFLSSDCFAPLFAACLTARRVKVEFVALRLRPWRWTWRSSESAQRASSACRAPSCGAPSVFHWQPLELLGDVVCCLVGGLSLSRDDPSRSTARGDSHGAQRTRRLALETSAQPTREAPSRDRRGRRACFHFMTRRDCETRLPPSDLHGDRRCSRPGRASPRVKARRRGADGCARAVFLQVATRLVPITP